MSVKFTDLQCKEVICISDGRRLGFVSDVQIEIPEGNICALVVPGPSKPVGPRGPWTLRPRIRSRAMMPNETNNATNEPLALILENL